MPVAARVRLDLVDLADRAAVDQALDGQEVGVAASIVEYRADRAALPGGADHVGGFLDGQAEGLLADDVLAGPAALDGQRGVRVVRGDQDGQRDLVVGEHVVHRRVGLDAREVVFGDLQARLVGVTDRRHLQALTGGDRLGVELAHVEGPAVADHRAPDRSFEGVRLAADPPKLSDHLRLERRVIERFDAVAERQIAHPSLALHACVGHRMGHVVPIGL